MGRFRKELPVTINGNTHIVVVDPKMTSADIFVNNTFLVNHQYRGVSNWIGAHEDVPIVLDGVYCIVAIRSGGMGYSIRIAIGGKYIDNGDTYFPAEDRPIWTIIFPILCIANLFWGGFLWGSIAMLFSFLLCTKVINNNTMNNGGKVAACSAIVLGSWAVAFLLSYLMAILLL